MIKRYDWGKSYTNSTRLTEQKDGQFVKYSSYTATISRLETELAAMRGEVERLRCCGNCEHENIVIDHDDMELISDCHESRNHRYQVGGGFGWGICDNWKRQAAEKESGKQ